MKSILIPVLTFCLSIGPQVSFANPALAVARAASGASRTAAPIRSTQPTIRQQIVTPELTLRNIDPIILERLATLNPLLANELVDGLYQANPSLRGLLDSASDHGIYQPIGIENFRTLSANLIEACDGKGPAQAFVAQSVASLARQVRVRPHHLTSEDLAQTFWTKFDALCRGFEVKSEEETRGLIITTLNNIARDEARLQSTRVLANVDASSAPEDHIGLTFDQTSFFESKRGFELLGSILTLRERQALGLRVMGYTYQESASIMGISKDRVKDLLSAARNKALKANDMFANQVSRR